MSLLFLLASLGVINGFIASIYLITNKRRTISDIYFVGLILTLCIRIGKSVLYYFFPETDRLVLQLGLSACIFIGPFFYLYLKALYQQQKYFKKNDLSLLAILFIGITSIGILFPYRTNPEYWNPEIVQGIYLIWALFVLLGIVEARKLLGTFKQQRGEKRYLIVILLGVVFITLTYQLALHIQFTYIWGAFLFSILFYVLGFRVLSKGKSITPRLPARRLKNGEQMLKQIEELMRLEKPYRHHDFKLESLADAMKLSRHQVSQVMNEVYGKGYTQYIKELRVNEAKNLIATRPELSLEGIGYESGFQSKSSFFEAFKKITHLTPAVYKKELEGNES